MPKLKESEESLKGWTAIAKFLSQPVSTAQRWANEGMPVTRIGRYAPASRVSQRSNSAGDAAEATVHIPSASTDLLSDLKRGLSEVRKAHRKSSRS